MDTLYLMDMAVEKNLVIANTQFCKKRGKLWTYISLGGSKCQLDYILMRKKWRNSLLNAEAYNTFASVGSDHRIVSARVRLSLRKSKTLQRKKQRDWNLLCTDSNLQKLYSIEVSNRFQPLENADESATEKYERFITANKEAAEKLIPVRKKARKVQFSKDTRVIEARKKINDAYNAYQQDTSEEKRLIYKQAKKSIETTYNDVVEEDLTSKLKEVEMAHVNSKHGQSWRLINDISGRKTSAKGQLKDDTQKERVKNWFNHFKNLLGSPPDIDDEEEEITPVLEELDIKTGPFDQEEYEKAKKSLVEGKSCGEDGIQPEVLKRCDMDAIILSFCNNALVKGEKPSQWSVLVFVKDSILGNWPKYERRRREENRARSASASAEGARVRRRRKASAASLSPEAQEIPRSGIESLLLWPNFCRLQVTLPVKIGYAPSRRSTDLLPKLTQHAAI